MSFRARKERSQRRWERRDDERRQRERRERFVALAARQQHAADRALADVADALVLAAAREESQADDLVALFANMGKSFAAPPVTVESIKQAYHTLRGEFGVQFEPMDQRCRRWLRTFLARVELANAPIPMTFEVCHGWWNEVVLRIHCEVRDRDTGKQRTIFLNAHFPFRLCDDERGTLKWLRCELAFFYLHELDEALHVNGVRANDPHARGYAQIQIADAV